MCQKQHSRAYAVSGERASAEAPWERAMALHPHWSALPDPCPLPSRWNEIYELGNLLNCHLVPQSASRKMKEKPEEWMFYIMPILIYKL